MGLKACDSAGRIDRTAGSLGQSEACRNKEPEKLISISSTHLIIPYSLCTMAMADRRLCIEAVEVEVGDGKWRPCLAAFQIDKLCNLFYAGGIERA